MSEEKDNTQSPESETNTRWGMILAWAFVLGLLTLVGIQLANKTRVSAMRGDPAPMFTLTTFDGQVYDLAQLRGKVVLINFWASWCIPCEDEADELQAAWEYFEESGQVVFLGIDYADTESKALEFLEKYGVTYPNGPDLGTKIAQTYQIKGVPETFIVDKYGKLAFVLVGPFQSAEDIMVQIEPLLDN